MKKIGFIDYFLHEWHAVNYPSMIKDEVGDEMTVAYAYAMRDHPLPEAPTNAEWAKENNVVLLDSIEELVNKCDYLVLLSPDNPEFHEELAQIPAASGKRLYIDKTFAPDKATAERIFKRAENYNTPCYSCSALNFADEYLTLDKSRVEVMHTSSPGTFGGYIIHQLEPIVKIMNTPARRVMFLGDEKFPSMTIEFEDGRRAQVACFPRNTPMLATVGYKDGTSEHFEIQNGFYKNFIREMVSFFRTGEIPVSHKQTIDVIALREAGLKAAKKPFEWIKVV